MNLKKILTVIFMFFVLIILIILYLTYNGYMLPGDYCGGLTHLKCLPGYQCVSSQQPPGNDSGGTCVPQW